jgi:uncharacterized protein YndB with AHSA1/START domain
MKPRWSAALALAAGLAACGPDAGEQDRLAAAGKIDDGAPIQAEAEMVILAPPERIWTLLTDVRRWPVWQDDVADAKMDGEPGVNSDFVWRTGAMQIGSTMRQFKPDTALAWTGQFLFFRAIHTWTLKPCSDGRTIVHTRESMGGPMIISFYSSLKLQESEQNWLASLKRVAEARQF